MSMGTAYANDPENEEKFVAIIQKIANKIDKAKSISLSEKCLVWMANTENQLICKCGYFLLLSILSAFSEPLLPRNILEEAVKICISNLKDQGDKLEIYYEEKKENLLQKESLKKNPEWAGIIEK